MSECFLSYRLAARLVLTLIIAAWASSAALAQASLPPLQSGAKVLHSETNTIRAAVPGHSSGAGSNLFVPSSGIFTVDYSVESGKQLMVTMLTDQQYQALS